MDPWQEFCLQHALGETEEGLWSAFEAAVIVSRQNGKGSILEARELAGLELFGEMLIIHTAHEMKTALEAFRRIESLFKNYDELRKKVKRVDHSNGEEGIELLSGARLRFLARSKGSGRGFTGDCIMFDEAFALTSEQKEAMIPTLSAVPNPQIWYMSSPPLDAVLGEQLFKLRRRALAAELDPDLLFIDYGLDGILDEINDRDPKTGKYLIDIHDPALWRVTNPSMHNTPPRISERFVAKEVKTMSREGFARERLGIWPRDLGEDFQIISVTEWGDALWPSAISVKAKSLSFDISRDRSRAAIGVAGRAADNRRVVELTGTEFEIDARLGTGWLVARIVEICKRNEITAVVVDAGSEAGTEIPALERAGIEVHRLTAGDVARAWGIFYDAVSGEQVEARNLVHIGQPELTAAVAGALKRELAGGHAWDRKNSNVDITPLVAVTNALLGSEVYGHREPVRPFAIYA